MIFAILVTSLFEDEKGKVKDQNHSSTENQNHTSLQSEGNKESEDTEK